MNTTYTPQYGGFWRRLFAHVLDSIIILIVTLIVLTSLGFDAMSNQNPVLAVLQGLSTMLYFAFMESSPLQGTLGKLALHLKVTDLKGKRISFGRALGRNLSKIFSAIILMVGYIMIAFTRRKQGLHDYITDCLVLCRCSKEAHEETAPVVEVQHPVKTPDPSSDV